MHSLQRKVLRTICPDQKGLIARITNICYKHELNIVQNNEFVDHRTGRFFMRTELEGIFNDYKEECKNESCSFKEEIEEIKKWINEREGLTKHAGIYSEHKKSH